MSHAPLLSHPAPLLQALYDYTVTLSTGTELTTPYTGAVKLIINGWYGSTQEVEVVPKGYGLKPGSTETFSLRADDIGCPSSIELTTVSR